MCFIRKIYWQFQKIVTLHLDARQMCSLLTKVIITSKSKKKKKKDNIIIANVGDSRSVLAKKSGKSI